MNSPEKGRQRKNKRNSSLSRIPIRLNILMGVVVVMLGTLAYKAYRVQTAEHNTYTAAVQSNTTSTQVENVQRGNIMDSTGKVLVANKGDQSIQYTKPANVSNYEMYKVANQLTKYVKIPAKQLSPGNYASYYIQDPKRAKAVAKKLGIEYLPTTDQFVNSAKSYVEKHENKFPLTPSEKNAAMLYQKMNNALANSTVQLKTSNVTDKEIAAVGERQAAMPGVSVGMYYRRSYPSGDAVKSLLGTEGKIPDDQVNQLLAQGYSQDDMTGTSFLEKEYESQLKGTKKRVEITTSPKTGHSKTKTLYPGQAGSNLVLTLNEKFQEDVRQALTANIPSGPATGGYAVVMNPQTGAIYAMVGVDRNNQTGELTNNDAATINKAQVMGSVVKPAMITTAMMQGVITPDNNTLVDQPIKVAGTPPKMSWFNDANGSGDRSLTAQEALEASSNSYVMQLMFKMGGTTYYPNMGLASLNPNVFNIMRNGLAKFGMGVQTGVDLPGEVSGLKGATGESNIGLALDESFGQYDTFTTIQLAQYASTIANGGYRVQPHLVQAIENVSKNGQKSTLTTIPTKILGTVGWTSAERNVILEGMSLVVRGTSPLKTGGSKMETLPVHVNMKTGTAETFTNGQQTYANTTISYVPNSNVAVAVVIPDTTLEASESDPNVTATYQIWQKFLDDVENKDQVNASVHN